MQMSREFIRETIKSIKAEKDKIKNELATKFATLEQMLSQMGTNIENSFRMNFPQNPTYPMVIHQGVIASLSYASMDSVDILQGNTEVITTFKRHIEFLKLLADPIKREQLDKVFNKYFVYWNSEYFAKRYVGNLSQDGRTAIPNPVMSLPKVSDVFGWKDREAIVVKNSDSDVWATNAIATYSYNHSLQMFDIELDNSLSTTAQPSTINSCPELDINICAAIVRFYKEKYGFDYNKFIQVNDEFIGFITELLTAFLKTRYADWQNIKRKDYEYGDFDLVYKPDFKFSLGKFKTRFNFIFKLPSDPTGETSNRKNITISIDEHHWETVDKITVKLDGVYQTLNFSLSNRSDENSEVVFDGYDRNSSSKPDDRTLIYFTEDYKLFVLYYGGQLLAKKEEIMLEFNNSITNRLAEQKGDEAIKGVE